MQSDPYFRNKVQDQRRLAERMIDQVGNVDQIRMQRNTIQPIIY